MQNATSVQPVENKQAIGSFGTGVLARLATEFFGDLQLLLSVPKDKADAIARAFQANYGRMMARDAEVSYKISRANKDGMCNLAFAAKAAKTAGTNMTNDLALARACMWVQSMKKEHLIDNQDWQTFLSKDLQEYITRM